MSKLKLFLVIIGIAILSMVCVGCNKQQKQDGNNDNSIDKSGEEIPATMMSTEEQLQLIMENESTWKKQNDMENVAYAITDLDFNGRLEIIAASFGGTGMYTYSDYYEVNELFNGLDLLSSNITEGESGADIITDEYVTFYDATNNIYHYILTDVIRVNAREHLENKRDFVLKDGKITETFLANGHAQLIDDRMQTEYTLPSGDAIDEDTYKNIENTAFKNLEKRYLNVEWIDQIHYDLETMSKDSLSKLLKKSFDSFGFSKIVTRKTSNMNEADKQRREAYGKALKDLYYDEILPGGLDAGYDDYNDKTYDKFAIGDIDNDGKEELIISHTATAMAGMVEAIYEYDISTKELKEELTTFPNLIYFDNGVIEAGWSHNQGKAGNSFWPYTLYQYDSKNDEYVAVGMVDAWDKKYTDEVGMYPEDIFPEETDKDGDRMIYYITSGDSFENEEAVDWEEYHAWRNAYTGNAKKIKVIYLDLTEENILIK